jgi:hypothetical protein
VRDWFSLTPRAQVTRETRPIVSIPDRHPDKSHRSQCPLSSLRSCWIWLCLTGAPCGEGGLSNSIAIDRSSEQFLSSDAERERTYQQANGVQQKQRHDAPLQRPAACDSTMEYSKWPTASLQQCSRSWTHWDDSACAWRLLSAANPLKHSV